MVTQQRALAGGEVQRVHAVEQQAGRGGDALRRRARAGGRQQPPHRQHPAGNRQDRRHHGHHDEDDEDSPPERKRHIPPNLGNRLACDNSTRSETAVRGAWCVVRGARIPALSHAPRTTYHARGFVKSHTHYLWFNTKRRQEIIDITDTVAEQVTKSGVAEGVALVSAMHITASVFVNDHESGDRKSVVVGKECRCGGWACDEKEEDECGG